MAAVLLWCYDATVLNEIANTDYEGEIKEQGDTVYIRTCPDVTVNDHVAGQVLTYQQLKSAPVTLLIDKGKSWSFVTKVPDGTQTDIKNYIELWSDDASEQMKIAIDNDVLGNIYADVHASNKGAAAGVKTGLYNLGVDGGTSISLTKANVCEYIVDCGTVLDEQSVPSDGRFMVIPPWMANLITKSDLKDASLSGDGTSMLRNGRIGMVGRFTLYLSNLVPYTTDGAAANAYHVLFGTKHALTFASQLVENEDLPNPWGFGRLYRGLQVYGYKVVKSSALGDLYCKRG